MPKTKKMSGGCGSCGMVGGCGCSLKQTSGGRKKTKKVTKGGSIMGNIIESAKTFNCSCRRKFQFHRNKTSFRLFIQNAR